MKTEDINALEIENTELKRIIECYKAEVEVLVKSEEKCAIFESEINSLRNTIKNCNENFTEHLNALETENEKLKEQIETFRKTVGTDSMYIRELKSENQKLKSENQKLKSENQKLCEKSSELHTIKKSFEVLSTLYLGDYENDDPF